MHSDTMILWCDYHIPYATDSNLDKWTLLTKETGLLLRQVNRFKFIVL